MLGENNPAKGGRGMASSKGMRRHGAAEDRARVMDSRKRLILQTALSPATSFLSLSSFRFRGAPWLEAVSVSTAAVAVRLT